MMEQRSKSQTSPFYRKKKKDSFTTSKPFTEGPVAQDEGGGGRMEWACMQTGSIGLDIIGRWNA